MASGAGSEQTIKLSLVCLTIEDFVAAEVDSGKLIIQGVLPVMFDDNEETLIKKIHLLEHKILPYGISEAGYFIRNESKGIN